MAITSAFWIGVLVVTVVIGMAFLGTFTEVDEDFPLDVRFEYPAEIRLGEKMELKILVRNPHASTYTLVWLDIEDRFLDGFRVTGVFPDPDEEDSSLGSLTYYYNLELRQDAFIQISIYAEAVRRGYYRGVIEICDSDENSLYLLPTVDVLEEGSFGKVVDDAITRD